ncbi:MAG TPA: NRDE family protein [Candidatus Binataceae bacterium]|nr:NRDE family protein [Candidatus Binataceae bacterium]
MCTLAIYFRVFPDYPVVLVANRDEYLSRPASAPEILASKPQVIGGKDLKAGGTWLGINQHGLVAGLLNRRAQGGVDPARRSRGLLCLEALRYRTASEALEFVQRQDGGAYNPFNLLIVSRAEALVAYNRRDLIETARLAPGLHLLTNLDVDDFECPKISRAFDHFAELARDGEFAANPLAQRARLRQLLADHATPLDSRSAAPNAICLHLDDYGTRSSSMIFLGAEAQTVAHFFAPGPPCVTEYEPAAVPIG